MGKTRIMGDAEDKYVSAVVIYADSSKELFWDEDCTEEVDADDVFNLFIKGVVCLYDGKYYRAANCTADGTIDFGFPTI